jgi:predicted HD phosphohydrolase
MKFGMHNEGSNKMEYEFEQVIWESADGRKVSRSGGRDLQAARRLEKQGLAKVEVIGRRFLGYHSSYDYGSSATAYKVTFL